MSCFLIKGKAIRVILSNFLRPNLSILLLVVLLVFYQLFCLFAKFERR